MKSMSAMVVATLATAGVAGGAIYFILGSADSAVESASVTVARSLSDQVATLRTVYTQEIVPRAKKSGMHVNYDFASKQDTLPLPASMVKFLGQAIERDNPGSRLRLYSRYPFPHRKSTESYDSFETTALDHVEKNPHEPYWTMDTLAGKRVIRYVAADMMRLPCVDCHNSHAESPKRDWKVGDVRGAVEVMVTVEDMAQIIETRLSHAAMGVGGGSALLLLIFFVALSRAGSSGPK